MKSNLNIYKASAGSGKTFTLTIEYIYLMVTPHSRPDEYQHTLAVTFTNKATAEMKDRILQHLYGIWQGTDSSHDYLDALLRKFRENHIPITPTQIRHKAGEALRSILHDYSHFRVETIDSFFQSILRSLARELGQSARLQVDLDDAQVVDQAVDRIIDQLEEDPHLQHIVIDYITHQIDETGRWNITATLKDFARQIFSEPYMQRTTAERTALSDDTLIRQFRTHMRQITEDTHTQLQTHVSPLLHDFTPSLTSYLRYKTPITYLQNLLDGKEAKWTDTLDTFLHDPTALLLKKYQDNPTICAQITDLSQRYSEILPTLDHLIRRTNTALLSLRNIHPLQLLGRIDNEVHRINEENERFNLSQTPTLLSKLIEGQDAPFVFEKTGTEISNVMIDEFQDTSQLQWNNFRILLFENQSIGGSDLIVGDIKQSIYRWRGGDWNLLRTLSQNMKAWSPHEHTLDTNHRSEYEIVQFNNTFFLQAARHLDTLDPQADFHIADIYNEHDLTQNLPSGKSKSGSVSVSIMAKGTKSNTYPKRTPQEIEDWMLSDMLRQIQTLHTAGLPLEDMAILIRTNKSAPRILEYFRKNAPQDIRIASDEAYLLSSSPLVSLLITTLRMFITDPTQNPIPQRQFLLSYYKDVLRSDLTVHDIMTRPVTELMPTQLTDRLTQLTQMPLYELVEELYIQLHLSSITTQEAYHFAFLDTLQSYLRDNPNDIHSFLEMWDQKYSKQSIPSGKTDGIRILTIHKSKGLEFHTVFLPFCDWPIESDRNDTLWCSAEEQTDEFNTLGPMPIPKSKTMDQSHFHHRYRREHLESRVDELNTLYVAFTRASRNMYIYTLTSATSSLTTIGDLINHTLNPSNQFPPDGIFTTHTGTPVTQTQKARKSDNRLQPDFAPQTVTMQTYSAHFNFRQSNETLEMLQGITNRQTGIQLHSLMSHIVSIDHLPPDLPPDIVRQIQTDPLIHSWFIPENTVFNECAILNPQRHDNRRPDRVIINRNQITVIDYKFGQEHNQYDCQVRTYMQLIRKMYPHHFVTGYLWYVHQNTVTEVPLFLPRT